jgi:DNA-binding NtrC family response regulator
MDRKPCLLIVDDEESILETLRLILERHGYKVITAESCAEALEFFQAGAEFDAVITDLNMEREDIGLEVARAATELRPKPAIVILTGFANMSNARAALEIGVDYMANKPLAVKELTSVLDRLIPSRRERGNRSDDRAETRERREEV